MNWVKAVWTTHKGRIIGLSAVAFVCLVRFALGLPCPVQYVVGISCPGCGMTRALWSMVTLDLSAALHYHPACFALPVLAILLILLRRKGVAKATTVLLAAFVLLLLGIYVWRLAVGTGDVVIFAPQNGLIGRLIRHIGSHFP